MQFVQSDLLQLLPKLITKSR